MPIFLSQAGPLHAQMLEGFSGGWMDVERGDGERLDIIGVQKYYEFDSLTSHYISCTEQVRLHLALALDLNRAPILPARSSHLKKIQAERARSGGRIGSSSVAREGW